MRIAIVLFSLLFGFIAAPAHGQDDDRFANVEITVTPIRDGLALLTGQGGNIVVSTGADGSFIIDDQFAALSDKIRAAIASLSDKPVRFVLNTHLDRKSTRLNSSH